MPERYVICEGKAHKCPKWANTNQITSCHLTLQVICCASCCAYHSMPAKVPLQLMHMPFDDADLNNSRLITGIWSQPCSCLLSDVWPSQCCIAHSQAHELSLRRAARIGRIVEARLRVAVAHLRGRMRMCTNLLEPDLNSSIVGSER